MRQDIKLYIGGREIDWGEAPQVAMTYQLEDLKSPPSQKVSYSKTISIPSTQNNDAIFAQMWNLDRIQEYTTGQTEDTGIYFDPSKRVSCVMLNGGDLVEEGYVKLDTITIERKEIMYNVTFYGSLGDFFYKLSYNDDGDEMTLADLDYTTENGSEIDFNMTINKDTVRNAWYSLQNTTDDKWKVINFAPCYNGVPDGMAADTAVINMQNNHTFDPTVTNSNTTYSAKDGYLLASLDRDMTEWETRDLRAVNQRPVISVKAFWRAIEKKANDLGFVFDKDPNFFCDDNPYYTQGWITLPMLSTIEDEGKKYIGTTNASQIRVYNVFSARVPISANRMQQEDGTKTIPIEGMFTYDLTETPYGELEMKLPFSLCLKNDYQNILYTYCNSNNLTDNAWTIQLVAYDEDMNAIGGSDIYCFTSQHRYKTSDYYNDYNPEYPGNFIPVVGMFKNGSFGSDFTHKFTIFDWDNYDWGEDKIDIVCKVPKKADKINFRIIAKQIWRGGRTHLDRTYLFKNPMDYNPVTAGEYTFYANVGNTEYVDKSTFAEGKRITKEKLLGNKTKPCDYLLSYTKLFGLYWVSDVDKTIHIYTRNKFFTGEMMDITKLIDHSTGQTITPITFDSKYYDLKLDTPDSEMSTKYLDDYGYVFGRERINTNYNFDNSVNDIYSDNVFKGAVMAQERRVLFRSFRNGDYWYPAPLYYGMDVTYFNPDDVEDTFEKKYTMNEVRYTNWSRKGPIDVLPKVCFNDSKDDGIDGENVLLFFNGFQTMYDVNGNLIDYWLTDAVMAMSELNDEEACWLITESEYDKQGNRIANKYNSLPYFSRYYMDGTSVKASWDFGVPREVYIEGINYTEGATIYNKFWKRFLEDQYDVNTRIYECYVLFEGKVNNEMLRKLYIIDNAYYVLNKISDYQIGSNRPTKCQFIKIMDVADYTQGQNLWAEMATISLSEGFAFNGPTQVPIGNSLSGIITSDTGYIVDLSTVRVYDNGVDITADVYNPQTGELNIPSVNGNIEITGEARKFSITITPVEGITQFPESGGTTSFVISSNVPWEINKEFGCAESVVFSQMSGEPGITTITVGFPENKTGFLRQAFFNVSGVHPLSGYPLMQAGVGDTLRITKELTGCTLSNSADTIIMGDSYETSVVPEEGYTIQSVKVYTYGGGDRWDEVYDAYDPQTGKITLGYVDTPIKIVAQATDGKYLMVDKRGLLLDYTASTTTMNITSNVEWTISIEEL